MGTKQALNHTKVSAVDSMCPSSTTTSRFRAIRETPISLALIAEELYALYTSGYKWWWSSFSYSGSTRCLARHPCERAGSRASEAGLASCQHGNEIHVMEHDLAPVYHPMRARGGDDTSDSCLAYMDNEIQVQPAG
jgi:hypothetical protein